MKFTPIHGWPVTEDTDVVKQYPTTIDDPFKTALDEMLNPHYETNAPWFYFQFGTALMIQGGSAVAMTNTNGDANLSFAWAFPVQCGNVLAVCGGAEATPLIATYIWASATNTTFGMQVRRYDGGIYANQNVRISYLAWGS